MVGSYAHAASLCGILKRDGSDCDRPVPPGVPFNVCAKHLAEIAQFARATAKPKVRLDRACPGCNVRALIATVGETVATCANCQHEMQGQFPPPQPRPFKQPERTAVVYYIRFGDRIKIGTTMDIGTRLQALPHEELLLTEPGSYELEGKRHRQFNRHLIAGREWFEAAPELLDFIATRRAQLAA